jgi:hypothetical protein
MGIILNFLKNIQSRVNSILKNKIDEKQHLIKKIK